VAAQSPTDHPKAVLIPLTVKGGAHGCKDRLHLEGELILALVEDEKPVRGLAPDGGLGLGREECDCGLAQAAAGGAGALSPFGAVSGAVKAVFEAFDAHAAAVAGGAVDDVAASSPPVIVSVTRTTESAELADPETTWNRCIMTACSAA
jgi:hypothetical protein